MAILVDKRSAGKNKFDKIADIAILHLTYCLLVG